MNIRNTLSLVLLVTTTIIIYGCGKSPEKKGAQKKDETIEQKRIVSSPDSVIISVSMKGRRDRLNILQQKVMLMAKKKLADSLIKLQNMHKDTSITNPNDYEVSLHDMHVMNEGLRYPDKNKPDIVEAYITLGIKYDRN